MRAWPPRARTALALLAAGAIGCGCSAAPPRSSARTGEAPHNPSPYGKLTSAQWAWGATWERRDLAPVPNTNPDPEPQPHRDHPTGTALSPDGRKLYVTLGGSEAEPGHEVAVFDVRERRVTRRIPVGSRPGYVAFMPQGRFALVLNRFSNYGSVIDSERDEVVAEIPLDFYCNKAVYSPDGTRAWISNRYLDQVLVLDMTAPDAPYGRLVPQGGFDPAPFLAPEQAGIDLHAILHGSCGGARCHDNTRGGYYAGEDRTRAWFSAIESSSPGDPGESLLLRAILPVAEGGFADERAKSNLHAGGLAVWNLGQEEYAAVADWIRSARTGPGIEVGNFGSKPSAMALSSDGTLLFVGAQGTHDVSIVDVASGRELAGIHIQNLVTDLSIARDPEGERDVLLVLSMGIGFGVARERDPYGGETTDPASPLAQRTVIRDVATTEPLPLPMQSVLGPFDAVDGTAAFKMADINNDLLAVDLSRLVIPPPTPDGTLRHALRANRYEAHDGWVRYTSDSAEILPQDFSGDIPPELQRVVGAFPESIDVVGDRAFVAMAGSYELVEWRIDRHASEASELMAPVAVYPTGVMPWSVAAGRPGTEAQGLVFVADILGETVTVVDTAQGTSEQYPVGDLSRPFPDSNAERGEMFVTTAVFSVDGDTSCTSCHIYGASDGRGWGAGQAIAQMRDGMLVGGGMLGIPQLNNLFATQPFYFEGTHTAYDAQFDDAREHVALQGFLGPLPAGDYTAIRHPLPEAARPFEHEEIQDKMSTASWGTAYFDLNERRDEHIRRLAMRHFGKAFAFRDFQRFIGDYQAAETRLVPNPFDQDNPSVQRGRLLFSDLGVGCVVCHKPPAFTDKGEALYNNQERALPQLISFTPRESAFTLVGPHWMDTVNGYRRDLEYWERGRVERTQGMVTTFPLRGLSSRPFALLHHGRALSVRESFAAPDHYSLRRFRYPVLSGGEVVRPSGRERGFNELSFLPERTYMMDTHGATSHLSARQVADLENFLLAIE